MPLKGRLQEFSLPDLFQLIHFGKKNGTLVVTNGEAKGYVCFRNGNVFFATHNYKRPPLGERLLKAGMITQEQLRQSLDLQSSSHQEKRLGNILCELGYLSRESLEVFVEEQIRDAVFNLLQWTEGKFDFDPDEIYPEEDIGLSMSTEDLILEGSRRMDEWYQLEKKVPSLDSIFKMVQDPGKDASEMNLTSDEWLVIYHIDGESTVRDIIEKSGQSALVTCRALYGLVTAGLVSLAGVAHPAPVIEDVAFEDDGVGLEDEERPGRGAGRRRKLPWRIRKETAEDKEEQEGEQEVVSLGDEPEEEITVEEVVVEGELEDSRKWGIDAGRGMTEPQEVSEEEAEAEDEGPQVEVEGDWAYEHEVTGEEDGVTPEPGQSLVDYYKSLALQEATDTDSLKVFEETDQKKAEMEGAADSVEDDGPVLEVIQEEEDRVDGAGKSEPESPESREIPFEWETGPVEDQVQEDEEAGEPVEDDRSEPVELTGGEAEAPVAEEPPTVEEAPLPSGEDIEKLLQVTPPSRELSREELLAFDQPTYAITDSHGDLSEPDTVETDEKEITEAGPRIGSGAADTENPRHEREAAEATQQADYKQDEELGRIIQFSRPGAETGAEVLLEEPEPIVKPVSVDRIAAAEDLHVAFDTAVGQAAPEIDEQREMAAPEAMPLEEIPLVFDATRPAGEGPEAAGEPEQPDGAAGELEIVGLDESGADMAPVDAAGSISAAEELGVAPAASYAEETEAAPPDETAAAGPGEEAAEDAVPAEQVQPEPQEAGEFSGQAAEIVADHVSEGFVEPPPAPMEELFTEQPFSPEGYEHLGTLRELSSEEPEIKFDDGEKQYEREPEAPQEQPQESHQQEALSDDLEDEVIMEPLKVSGKRDAGTSLIDLETLELEQELLELAGGETKKEDRKPVGEKQVKKKKKGGRGKSKGKEVDKGSVKKIIDDMKKM